MGLIRRVFRIALDALYAFGEDDGWALASHIALSALLALFPFLIVLTALAGYFGSRDMADDVAQDAFERAFAALSRFDERRPFAPWLHRIVVNRSLDLLRSERRLVGMDSVDRIEGEWRDAAEEDRALLQAVSGLSPQRRVAIVLRYGVGLAPAEIADMLGLPVGTIHSRLARGLEDLRGLEKERDAERA